MKFRMDLITVCTPSRDKMFGIETCYRIFTVNDSFDILSWPGQQIAACSFSEITKQLQTPECADYTLLFLLFSDQLDGLDKVL